MNGRRRLEVWPEPSLGSNEREGVKGGKRFWRFALVRIPIVGEEKANGEG